jgi:hypothetical protein
MRKHSWNFKHRTSSIILEVKTLKFFLCVFSLVLNVKTRIKNRREQQANYENTQKWIMTIKERKFQLRNCFCLIFLVGLELRTSHLQKHVLYHLSHTSSPFCYGWVGDGVLWTICLGWPWTSILISASQIARIIGVNHWCLAWLRNSYQKGTRN